MMRRDGCWSILITMFLAACVAAPRDDQGGVMRRGDDLLGRGGEVRVADSVAGDVMVVGGDLAFSGVAGGSYLGAGGEQRVGGRIDGDLRAAGGRVVVSGTVGRNATLAGGEIELDTGATIVRNAYLAGGRVDVTGRVGRELTINGGEVVLDGTVGGDVDVGAQRLRVGPRARVTGALRHSVPAGAVTIDSAARIGGGITALPAADWSGLGRLLRAIWVIGFLAAGAVVVALFPGLAAAAAASVRERAGVSAAFGALWLFILPVAIGVAAVTLVGLPLAVVATAAWVVLLYLGRAAVAVWLGELVLRRWMPAARATPIPSFFVGGVILSLVALVPVLSGLVGFIATIIGAGAVLVAVWPRRAPP